MTTLTERIAALEARRKLVVIDDTDGDEAITVLDLMLFAQMLQLRMYASNRIVRVWSELPGCEYSHTGTGPTPTAAVRDLYNKVAGE